MTDDGDPTPERTAEDGRAERTADEAPADEAGAATDGEAAGTDQDAEEAAGTDRENGGDDLEARVVARDELVERVAAEDEALAEDVDALYGAAQDLQQRVTDLEGDLADAEAEVEDLTERLKRKQADFENYKKRREREEQRIRERATEDLVERLLDVRDDLQRAVEGDYDDVEGIREGVKMTLSSFDRVLDAEDVRQVDPEPGTEVDPQRHEVMTRVESDQPEGTVADVYEPGYEMADTVLRAAKVTVSDGPADESGDTEEAAVDGEGAADDGDTDDGDGTGHA